MSEPLYAVHRPKKDLTPVASVGTEKNFREVFLTLKNTSEPATFAERTDRNNPGLQPRKKQMFLNSVNLIIFFLSKFLGCIVLFLAVGMDDPSRCYIQIYGFFRHFIPSCLVSLLACQLVAPVV